MTWYFNDKEFTSEDIDNNFGFIYRITDLQSNRKYIGRKSFHTFKIKQIKGKKKKYLVESDWKGYTGSCAELNADIEKNGLENYKREILYLCNGMGQLKYMETKYQFLLDVLEKKLDNGQYEYYNGNIMMKFNRKNITKG